MTENLSTTFVWSHQQSEEDGCPALLIRPDGVLVPRPAAHELNLESELEVVVVAPQGTVPVERIRVASGTVLLSDAEPGPALLLELERPSKNRTFHLGTTAEVALLVEVSRRLKEGDLWGLLLDLERVEDLPASVSGEILTTLRTVESTPRPPTWPQEDDSDHIISWIGDFLIALGKKK